jgi:succinate dehydrogenase/fumarate reductase flavoprotein subunit
LGVEFSNPNFSGDEALFAKVAKPAPRGHTAKGQGAALTRVLVKQIKDRGIETMFETRAERLIARQVDRTEVVGIQAKQGTKTLNIRAQKAVMLAAGGYCTNAKSLRKFCMESIPADPNPMMLYDNGDGILMAMGIGADLFGIDNLGLRTFILRGWPKGYAGYTRQPPSGDFVYVNLEGKRFVDESTFYGKIPDILTNQKEARCYMIFDEDVKKVGGQNIGWDFSN